MDSEIEMHRREEASNAVVWQNKLARLGLSPEDSDDRLGNAVGTYVNLKHTHSARRCKNNHTASFDLEGAKLLEQVHNTAVSSREIMYLLPYSTIMLENPTEAYLALKTWTDVHVQAIKIESHLTSRLDAASHGIYWGK